MMNNLNVNNSDTANDGYSLSTREMRQKHRNEMKDNRETIPNAESETETSVSFDDDRCEMSTEYCIKENTRRVKRSHEKKNKKIIIIDTIQEDAAPVTRQQTREKRDNTRRARRENVEPEKMEKHVSFATEKQPKPFRVPSGRFSKEKKDNLNNIVSHPIRSKKRVINVDDVKNYCEDHDIYGNIDDELNFDYKEETSAKKKCEEEEFEENFQAFMQEEETKKKNDPWYGRRLDIFKKIYGENYNPDDHEF